MKESFPGRFLNKQNPCLQVSNPIITSAEGLHYINMCVSQFLKGNTLSRVPKNKTI